MFKRKDFVRNISFAFTGWLGAMVSTVILSLTWPYIFPAIVNPENYYGAGPGLLTIMGIVLVLVTPAALIGGLVGGRVSVEGGQLGQRIIAIVFGVVLATPFGCAGLWFFTGF